MKQKIAIGILLVFCFTETRPLLPFVDYYLNYDYIASVLCINKDNPAKGCHGKCYLNQQIEKTQKTKDSKKQLPKTVWEKIPMIFYTDESSPTDPLYLWTHYPLPANQEWIKNIITPPPTPPPQLLIDITT